MKHTDKLIIHHMQKRTIYIIASSFLLIGLVAGVFQYVQTLKAEQVSAVTTGTPNPGHTWAQMQCSADTMCIDGTNKRVGIGTNTPSAKLDVEGTLFYKGINVAAYSNGGRVTECSGEYPDNYTSPYACIYNTPSTARAWSSYWLIDGDPATSSVQSAIDAGGEGGVTFFKVVFNGTYVIDRVRLAGRYDNYTTDGQPQTFQLDFSDGTVQTFTFPSSYSGMQEYNIRPVATSFIRYTTRSKYSAGNNGLRELEAYTRYSAINGTLSEQRNIFYSNAKGSELNSNVGIGTATPSQKLSVAGVIQSTTGGIMFPDGTVQTTANSGLAIITGSSPSCSAGTIIARKWAAKTCCGQCPNTCCSTTASWQSSVTPSCTYNNIIYGACNESRAATCYADSWSEAICVGD